MFNANFFWSNFFCNLLIFWSIIHIGFFKCIDFLKVTMKMPMHQSNQLSSLALVSHLGQPSWSLVQNTIPLARLYRSLPCQGHSVDPNDLCILAPSVGQFENEHESNPCQAALEVQFWLNWKECFEITKWELQLIENICVCLMNTSHEFHAKL